MNTADHPHEMLQPLGLFAGDLFARGIEYRDAFEMLTEKNPGKLLYASYFLFAHSLELFLKSYLAARGTTKTTIRCDLGHDLSTIGQVRAVLDSRCSKPKSSCGYDPRDE